MDDDKTKLTRDLVCTCEFCTNTVCTCEFCTWHARASTADPGPGTHLPDTPHTRTPTPDAPQRVES